jgi:hypothetical protein
MQQPAIRLSLAGECLLATPRARQRDTKFKFRHKLRQKNRRKNPRIFSAHITKNAIEIDVLHPWAAEP